MFSSKSISMWIDCQSDSKLSYLHSVFFRDSCSIDDGTSVIITGGEHYPVHCSRYNINGFFGWLPSLTHGRRSHACGAYRNDQGQRVNYHFNLLLSCE